jgi:hypothetical protein
MAKDITWVALDAHKKTHAVAVLAPAKEIQEFTAPNEAKAICRLMFSNSRSPTTCSLYLFGRSRHCAVFTTYVRRQRTRFQFDRLIEALGRPSCKDRLALRLTKYSGWPVLARETNKGWYPQVASPEISIPSLHSPVVATWAPSASMIASWKNDRRGCCRHAGTLTSLMSDSSVSTSSGSNRRQKSPAVVGSGIRWALRAGRCHRISNLIPPTH